MSSLLERLKSNSIIKDADVVSKSKFFNKKDMIRTTIPALNIAFSGEIDGGFTPGLTLWCGPSKHFKSMFSLIMAKTYMDKYPDSVMILYDCEFGTPLSYFESLDIDTNRVLHIPIMNMEEFKFDAIKQLENLKRGEKVIFVVDSIGNMASKKELEDAIEEKSTQDMSRAKQMKSIFRMITPYLTKLDVPMVAVNHVYKEQGCLESSTLIKTSKGPVEIKDIVVGDYVYALNGLKQVTRTYKPSDLPRAGKKFLELTFDDGSTVKSTNCHKFLTEDGTWVEAENLKIGDMMY